MNNKQFRKEIAKQCGYPRWVVRACDRIAAKSDEEPLTNTEAEAAIEYMDGPIETEATQACSAGDWPKEDVERRVYDAEDIEDWQYLSEREGAE